MSKIKISKSFLVVISLVLFCCVFYVYRNTVHLSSFVIQVNESVFKHGNKDTKAVKIISEKWPKIDKKNCSNIVYLNRGINAKNPLPLPRVGLVSYPGSGNTWMRYLIQQATGVWSGSIYHDKSLYMGGLKGEYEDCDSNSTIAIKAHNLGRACDFDKIIYVVRDPYGALLAEFNWLHAKSHTGTASLELYSSEIWTKFIRSHSKNWVNTFSRWFRKYGLSSKSKSQLNYSNMPKDDDRILLVSYEKVKQDTISEMERVFKFLGLHTFRKHCLEITTGNFKRKEKNFDAQCLYNNGARKIMNSAIAQAEKETKSLGIDGISSEFDSSFRKNPPNCSNWRLSGVA